MPEAALSTNPDDHNIEEVAFVSLTLIDGTWEVSSVILDAEPLDTEPNPGFAGNEACSCHTDTQGTEHAAAARAAHHEAAMTAKADIELPTGAQLVGLIARAAADFGRVTSEPAVQELLEIRDRALVEESELARLVRDLFGA